jgi:tetratricopeptide (TPR) repeat protein
MICQADGDMGGASDALRHACQAAPDYAPAHRELGAMLRERQDLRGAGAHLRRAGALNPMDPETHLQLGALYMELHQRDRAREHLQSVLHLAVGTRTAAQAARVLRDLDEGPSRRPGEALGRPRVRTTVDRDLIARTFSAPGDRWTNPGFDTWGDGPDSPVRGEAD